MTGYLARLAARAGGEAAAASPRVPSRFEPVAAGGRAAAFAASGTVHELRREPRPGLRPDVDVDVDDQGTRELERTAREGRADARDSTGATEPGAAGRPRQASRRRPSSGRAAARSSIDARAAVVSTSDSASASANGVRTSARPATGTTPPRADSVVPSAGGDLDAASAAAAARRRVVAIPRPGHAPVADRPDTAGRVERADHDDRPDVVQVTIDRVEVRATIAAPTVARSAVGADARRESSRSLHDYLAGRSR